MIPSSERLLELISISLEQDIIPDLTSPNARDAAGVIAGLITELRSRELFGHKIIADKIREASGLLAKATLSLDDTRIHTLVRAEASALPPYGSFGLRHAYEDAAARLIQAMTIAADHDNSLARAIETSAADWERGLLHALLAAQKQSACVTTGTCPKLTVGMVEAWINREEILNKPVRVKNLRPLTGGFSKGTFTFDVIDANGQIHPLVIRRNEVPAIDPHACFLQENEFRMMKLFHAAGIRLPRVIVFTGDPAILGGDATLMERALGENIGNVLQSSRNFTNGMAQDLARVLADLHNIDVTAHADVAAEIYGPAAIDVSVGERNRQLLTEYEAYWRREDVTPSPLTAKVFTWLKRNIPQSSAPARFIHGDYGLHNILFHQGRVSAVLDWETTQIGDPAQELAYLHDSIAAMMPWDSFMTYYQEAGGQPADAATIRYHLASRWLRNAVISDVARRRLDDRSYSKLAVGWLGTALQPQFLLKADEYAHGRNEDRT